MIRVSETREKLFNSSGRTLHLYDKAGKRYK